MPPQVPAQSGGASYGAQGFIPATPMAPIDYSGMEKPAGKRKALKIVGIVFGALFALLVVAYCAVAIYFNGRFMPHSTVGDMDVSLMTASEAEKVLGEAVDDYSLTIQGQGFKLSLTASDAGLQLDEKKVVQEMLSDVNPWLWPFEMNKQHDEGARLVATYNDSGLEQTVKSAVEKFNETAQQPVNATIAFDTAKNAYAVKAESTGTALDAGAVVKVADQSLAALDPVAKLAADQLLKPTVLSSDPALATAATNANTMIKADLVLTMAGSKAGEVNAALISQWITLGTDLSATLDEGALTAWVGSLAAACNTVGTERTYTRPDGKVVTVSGGTWGWQVDEASLLDIVKNGVASGQVGTVVVPCSQEGTAYNGAGGRDWGARYVDIDLAEQYARFYDASGAVVWETSVISGIPDGSHNTPTGVYQINGKQSPSKLIGYENGEKIYESTVQYWMPFVGNAIGLHDADWQPDFGGTMYKDGYGSHGCVNLPPSLAASLYGIIQTGDTVVCHW